MKNIRLINKLLELELDIVREVNEKKILDLKMQFDSILKKLKKSYGDYNYESPDDIIQIFISYFKYPKNFAISKIRKRETYVYPRQMCQVISRHIFTDKSLETIGSYFTNGDHATILNSIKTVKSLLETNKNYRRYFNEIQTQILGSIEITYETL